MVALMTLAWVAEHGSASNEEARVSIPPGDYLPSHSLPWHLPWPLCNQAFVSGEGVPRFSPVYTTDLIIPGNSMKTA